MPTEKTALRNEAPAVLLPATARDFLANERTFLAYIRTALSFLGFGFVIARFSIFSRELDTGRPLTQGAHVSVTLGVIMAVAGVVIGVYGTKRYVDADTALRRSEILALSPRTAMLMAGIVSLFGAFIAFTLYALR